MKPLTDDYRELRATAAGCRLHNVDPESDYHDSSLEVWDKEALGYEASLQAKDAQIAALVTMLEMARKAIISLPQSALGIGRDGNVTWSIRDELYDKVGDAIKEATG